MHISSIEEPPPSWAQLTPLKNYALTLGKSPIDSDNEDEAVSFIDESKGAQKYRVVAAARTTKVEIKE
jgi:hypothetical protein